MLGGAWGTQGSLDGGRGEGAADPGPVQGGLEAVDFREELLHVDGLEVVEF